MFKRPPVGVTKVDAVYLVPSATHALSLDESDLRRWYSLQILRKRRYVGCMIELGVPSSLRGWWWCQITIDDVTVVIDAGKVKLKGARTSATCWLARVRVPRECRRAGYDPFTQCSSLRSAWVSRASARQRAGRAGRVRPGVCYHLFSRARLAVLDAFAAPEILRAPLEEVALQIMLLEASGFKVEREAYDSATTGASIVETILAKAIQVCGPRR